MKTFLFALFTGMGMLLQAAVGTFHEVSQNWTVKTDYYTCTLFEGHPFPIWFKGPEGKAYSNSFFLDSVLEGKVPWSLSDERWCELRVIKNTEEEFQVEVTSMFCRNVRPCARELEGVKAVYLYTFRRNSPVIQWKGTVVNDGNKTLMIEKSACIGWKTMPFDSLSVNGVESPFRTENPRTPLIRDIRNGRVSLKGPGGEFTVQAGRIVIILAPSWNCKTMVNFGLWNTPLPPGKKQTFSAEWSIRF